MTNWNDTEEARIDRLGHGIAVRAALSALLARCAAGSADTGFLDHVFGDAIDTLDLVVDQDAAVWRQGREVLLNIFDAASDKLGGGPFATPR